MHTIQQAAATQQQKHQPAHSTLNDDLYLSIRAYTGLVQHADKLTTKPRQIKLFVRQTSILADVYT
jgi:hypothetical protein